MSQQEFVNIFQNCDVMSENFYVKELYGCYCNSIRSKNKNSGQKDGPFMNYFEFLEGLTRASEVVKVEKMKAS